MAGRNGRNAAAQTAYGPMVIVALEQFHPPERRLVDDPMAVRLLPFPMRIMVKSCGFSPLRALLRRTSDGANPGVWAGILCRKRAIETAIRAALDAGIGQFVSLGAGFDTSACRLAAPAGCAAYEVDLPVNSAAKRDALKDAFGAVPEGVTLVPFDFSTGDLATVLAAHGFDFTRPALFVWEGVTQYLDAAAVEATFAALAEAALGSRLVFSYVLADLIDGTDMHGAEKLYRRFVADAPIWKFGLTPARARALAAEHGWAVQEDIGAEDYVARYSLRPADALTIMRVERLALAEKAG